MRFSLERFAREDQFCGRISPIRCENGRGRASGYHRLACFYKKERGPAALPYPSIIARRDALGLRQSRRELRRRPMKIGTSFLNY
jgi:hypothetical protein